jgi:hypothetical protein
MLFIIISLSAQMIVGIYCYDKYFQIQNCKQIFKGQDEMYYNNKKNARPSLTITEIMKDLKVSPLL